VIAGTNQFEFARYALDTSASGEDLRLVSFPAEYNNTTGTATDLTNCFMYDGSVKLNTNSVVNPSARGSSTSFVFDGTGLTLTKGTTKTLSLKCDLKSAATGSYSWGYDTSSSPAPTGLVSGQTVAAANLTENDSVGQLMTAQASGKLTVALDTTQPYTLATPGQTVELAKLRYSATDEGVTVRQVTLAMSGAASNAPDNLVNREVTLWDGGTQVGTANFASGDRATGTLTGFVVPKDNTKVLTVKGTINAIGSSEAMNRSGEFPKVDYDGGGGLTSNYGTGVSSGQTVTPASAKTSSTGVRIVKSHPSLEKVDLTSSERILTNGSARTLYKFKVTANDGDVLLAKMTFKVSSSSVSATTTNFQLYAYTDSSLSTADTQINTTGAVNNTVCPVRSMQEIWAATGCGTGTSSLKIPAGASRWFKLVASVGSVAAAGTNENLEVQLEGDAAFPVAHQADGDVGEMGSAGDKATDTGVDNAANNDLIWSPTSTTTAGSADAAYLNRNDWTNGYGVPGLPGTNMTSETLSHQ